MKLRVLVTVSLVFLSFGLPAQNGPWLINVQEVELNTFIEEVATITGKTFVVDPRIRGNVTVISDTKLDRDGVYALLLSVLKTQEYSLIENGDIVEILQSTRARMQGGARQDSNDAVAADEWVTQVIDAGHLDPNEIIKAMRQLAPQHAQFSAIPESNAVLISDRKQNIDGMLRIVEHLKSAAELKSVIVDLKHTYAGDIVPLLEELLGELGGPLKIIANLRSNSLLLRGNENMILSSLETINLLDQPGTAQSQTRIFRLRQALAEDVASILKEMILSTESTRSLDGATTAPPAQHITIDSSLNAIVVKVNPTLMKEVESLIEQLDQRQPQVLIEAAIVEISLDEGLNFGVELGASDSGGDTTPTVSTSLNGVLSALLTGIGEDLGDDEQPDGADILANLSTPTLAIAKLDPDGLSFGAILNAVERTTNSNFLSTPSVMVLNNQPSNFFVGQEVPFRSGNLVFPSQDSVAGLQPTNRNNVGTTLAVTPFIHEDLSVRMSINQTVNSVASPTLGIGDQGFADVVTNNRVIETVVVAENQQTIVLGGLIYDETRTVVKRVPVLGSIPLLGSLFKSTNDTNKKQLLVVFIRPTVLTTPEEVDSITNRKQEDLWEIDFTDEKVERRPIDELF